MSIQGAGLEGRCDLIRSLHRPGDPLLLPNVWDVATAKAVVAAGFPVVATTSWGVAETLGYEDDEREVIPSDRFSFARFYGGGAPTPIITEGGLLAEQAIVPSDTELFIKDGFHPGWLYELEYTASSPLILGLGHAAIRDLISHLRHDKSAANPLAAAKIEKVYSWGRSQTGRHIRDYIYRGFNSDTISVFQVSRIRMRLGVPSGAVTLWPTPMRRCCARLIESGAPICDRSRLYAIFR